MSRDLTYLEDMVGAISSILSISAGLINMMSYEDGVTDSAW